MLPSLMRVLLSSEFFCRPTLTVARELLGKFLVREYQGKEHALIITEVEAYDGQRDKACHAHRGRTLRNAPMFGPSGFFYVYFVYGMHWMLNIVTGEEQYPAAVLIRGAGEWNGPGKLTRALHIDRSLNGEKMGKENGLWIEDRGMIIPHGAIERSQRIGVAYAEEWAKKPYRFVLDRQALQKVCCLL